MYCKVPIAFSKGNNWNPPKSIKNLFLLKLFKMKFWGLKNITNVYLTFSCRGFSLWAIRKKEVSDQRPLTPIASLGGSFKAQPQRKRNEWEEVEKAIQSAVQRWES